MSLKAPIGDSFQPPVSEGGESLKPTREYGVGIDCHSRFIVVSILISTPETIWRFERQFGTVWHDLCTARVWIDETLAAKLVNPPEPTERDYMLESTGCYHLPLIRALGGQPHIVNPTLAGGSRRKTDVLDSRLLAWQDLSGMWPRSYIVEPAIQALRAILLAPKKTMRAASAESSRADSMLLKFGYTFHVENGIAAPAAGLVRQAFL